MALYAGIDCGTQGTKVVIIDDQQGTILGSGSAPHAMLSDGQGKREQHAEWWITALIAAFGAALADAGVKPDSIAAQAVSGGAATSWAGAGDGLHRLENYLV